jgi:hypothetical protein
VPWDLNDHLGRTAPDTETAVPSHQLLSAALKGELGAVQLDAGSAPGPAGPEVVELDPWPDACADSGFTSAMSESSAVINISNTSAQRYRLAYGRIRRNVPDLICCRVTRSSPPQRRIPGRPTDHGVAHSLAFRVGHMQRGKPACPECVIAAATGAFLALRGFRHRFT